MALDIDAWVAGSAAGSVQLVTEDLYSRDAYLASCAASVIDVVDGAVILDRTVFYPRGGGQPGDTGTLRWDGEDCRVADTTRSREDGRIRHQVDPDVGCPALGTKVTAQIDWERRHVLMRTHTALHALSGIVFRRHGAHVTGGNIEAGGTARMDFELDHITQGFGQQVADELNARLAKDVPVVVTFLPRAEALADPDLIRTKVNLIPEQVDPIRVVDIQGIDRQADGGTHVRSTAEVGTVRVVKTESKGKGNKRMRIELGKG